LSGLDVFWRISQEFPALAGAGRAIEKLYRAGRYGQKTGAGFYLYDENRRPSPDPQVLKLIQKSSRAVSNEEIVERCIYALIHEGAKVLDEGIALRALDIDVIYLTGYGFPAYRGGPMFYGDTVGLTTYYRKDVNFYIDLCRAPKGQVLELGCGTGRLLIPAAEAGCTITGVDGSRSMLDRCRVKLEQLPAEVQKRVTLVEADMIDFSLDRQFALATVPFRPLQHLVSVEEQLTFLACVHRHLLPGAKLALDVFHPHLTTLASDVDAKEIEDTPEVELGDGRRMRRAYRNLAKRRAEQTNDIELIYYVTDSAGATTRIVQAFPMRYFFRYELEHLLDRSGFQVESLFGNFDQSPFMDSSPEMIVVAVRKD
jgi:SAM-dependent methyltransferase